MKITDSNGQTLRCTSSAQINRVSGQLIRRQTAAHYSTPYSSDKAL